MRRLFAHRQLDQELRKSEARYRTVLDAAFDAIVTITPDGVVRWFNRGAERIFGHRAEEVIGQPVTLLMPERYRELCVAGLHRYLRTGEARVVGGTIELVGLRKDGSEFPIEMSLGEILEDGERLFTGVIRDITERKQAEDALREARDRFRSIFDHAPIGVAMISLEGRYLQVNRSLCEILGYTEEQLQALTWQEITHPDDLATSLACARRIVEGEFPRYHLEKRFLHADGHTVWASLSVSLVRDAEGEPLYFVYQIQDVTERRKAERKLREAEQRYRNLVERVPAVVYIQEIGSPDSAMYMSPQIETLTGYTPEDCKDPCLRWGMVHPDDRERMQLEDERTGEPGEVFTTEYRVVHRDGRTKWVHNESVMLEDEVSGTRYWQGFMLDITERKRFEETLERLSRQHEMVLKSAGEGIFGLDLDGSATFVNPAAARMTGWGAEELLGRPLHDVLHHTKVDGTPYPREQCPIYAALEDGAAHSRDDEVFWRKDGTSFPVEYVSTPIFRDGEVAGAVVTFKDVTERKKVEKAIKESEERFRSLVQYSSDIITILEADGTVRYVSPAVERVMGYKPEEQVGTNAFGSVHPDYREQALDIFAEVLESPGLHPPLEFRVPRKDGSWRYLEHVVNNLLDDPAVRGVVVNSWDVTERKALEEQLRYQAFHDPLTELPNRVLFMDRLEHALVRANRRDSRIAVLFMDLDNFKVINDSLGHKAGDQLLKAVAERLKAHLRPEDTAARLSGDEFTILVEDVTGVGDVARIAERIAEILQPPFSLGEHEVFATVSTGIALNSPDQEQPADLLRHADLAMYRAKRRGKARYEVFESSMDAKAVKRLTLETGLRRALVREQFRVYYQPIVALENDKVVGVEALLRWEHPQRGLLLPGEFLSIAEETGLIVRIGQWVLREACKQARVWQERYPSTPPLTISVNLSPRQFFHPELVAEVLDECEIDPATLQLEITEGAMTSNGTYSADRTLRSLKHIGVQLAIDDFGLGYSSLSYLKRFPVDFLKIDRSFVGELGGKPNGVSKGTEIVKAMIDLTHALGLKVIAEGVENAEQLTRLRNMKCDLAQGYYFSEPLPSEALVVILEQNLTDRG